MPFFSPALRSALTLALMSSICPTLAQAAVPSSGTAVSEAATNPELARAIIQLYDADQALLADLAQAKKDPGFNRKYLAYRAQVETTQHLLNFGDPALYALWAREAAAPAIVHRAVEFRHATDAQLRQIVARFGWPGRQAVGDQAAASFFFLFGHADDDNVWRLTQLPAIERAFRDDRVAPRLYAHIRDRIADVAGKPQIFGTIMGPGKVSGTAKLYWPLIDTVGAADVRRAGIGLPSMETDLAAFRNGADIGPYMMPMAKGMTWDIGNVYPVSDATR